MFGEAMKKADLSSAVRRSQFLWKRTGASSMQTFWRTAGQGSRRKYGTEKRSAAGKQNKRKRAGTKAGTARFFVVSFRAIKYTIGNKRLKMFFVGSNTGGQNADQCMQVRRYFR